MNLKKTKEQLSEALGDDDMKTYLEYLKLWFRQKITRDDFDRRTRRLLKHQHLLRLHNEFMLELLADCQSFTTNSSEEAESIEAKKGQVWSTTPQQQQMKKKKKNVESGVTVNYPGSGAKSKNMLKVEFSSSPSDHKINPLSSRDFSSYCSNDLLLPDVSLIAGRAKITAWLNGLESGCSQEAAELLVTSSNNLLKRIATAAMSCDPKAIHQRNGNSSNPRMGPFGKPVFLKPKAEWPCAIFDAIYPELNYRHYSLDSQHSLLATTSYRELIETQQANLQAFGVPSCDLGDELTISRLRRTLELDYLDLNIPLNFRNRCLVRVNGSLTLTGK